MTVGNYSFIIHCHIATAALSRAAVLSREKLTVEREKISCQLLSPATLGDFTQLREIKPGKNFACWDGEQVGTLAAEFGPWSSFLGIGKHANS